MGMYLKPSTFTSGHLEFSPKAQSCPWSQDICIATAHLKCCLSGPIPPSYLSSPERGMLTYIWQAWSWFKLKNNAVSKYALNAYLFSPNLGSFMTMQPWISYSLIEKAHADPFACKRGTDM